MRTILVLCLFLLSVPASAEEAPLARPFLRIDPGMHTAPISHLAVSTDGATLVTASKDKTVRLWAIAENRLIRTLRPPIDDGDGGAIFAVAISPDGTTVAMAGYDSNQVINGSGSYVYLFDAATGALTTRLGPLANSVQDLAFAPDGRSLAAGLAGGSGVHLWQTPFAGPGLASPAIAGTVYDVDFGPGAALYAAADDGTLTLYGEGLAVTAEARLPHGAAPASIAISPDGGRIAISYQDEPRIDILSLPALALLTHVDTSVASFGNLGTIAWSADGETLYGSGAYFDRPLDRFQIFAWGAQGAGPPRLVTSTRNNILDMAALPTGGMVLATGDPSVISVDGGKIKLPPSAPDMRDKLADRLLISGDGTRVRFGLDYGGEQPWLFDADKLTCASAPVAPPGMITPDVASLPLSDWEDTAAPLLAGTPLPIEQGDTAHAIAVVPASRSLVLGTSWTITRFDGDGGVIWRQPAPSAAWGVNVSADGKIVIAAMGDGTIRWYRAIDGAPLLALFVERTDKRWIAWTPSGYYYASPGAEDMIGWQLNGRRWDETPKFYPASRFRERYYRPDVVTRMLVLLDEARAVAEADKIIGTGGALAPVTDQLPASVELLTRADHLEAATREFTIAYRLSSPTGRAVTRLEARIDGRPVESRGVSQDHSEFPLNTDLELALSLPPRDAVVSLVAFIGDQPSVLASIPVKWKGATAEVKKHNLYALLVGVSHYDDANIRLRYAAKDASDLGATLKNQEGIFYEKTDIVTLLDGDATRAAIEKQLIALRKKSGPDDTALVFFAGHGITDQAQDFYFLPSDADPADGMIAATGVEGRFIRKALAAIPGRVVLMMDTCRSGAGIEGAVDMTRTSNDMAQDSAGIVMFASSQGRENSLESPDWENGAFTEALLSILNDPKVYGDDGRLSIPEIEEAITVRVAELTEGRQNAGMTKYGATPRFFLAALKR